MPANMPVVVIGISGASSSSKTITSILLSEIFKPWKSVTIEETEFMVESAACPVTYFFDPKLMAIQPTPDYDCWNAIDVHRLIATIQHVKGHNSREGAEILARQPTHQDIHKFFQDQSVKYERYQSTIADQREKVAQWMLRQRSLSPGGLDVDHGDGIDGFLPTLCFVNGFLLYTNPTSPEPAPVVESFYRDAYTERSTSLPQVNQAVNNASVISINSVASSYPGIGAGKVPTPYAHQTHNSSTRSIPIKFSIPISECDASGSGLTSREPDTGDESGAEMPHCTTTIAKRELNALFDTKLFLASSKEGAKTKRFHRMIYKDSPFGARLPSEDWKKESYFEDVVWPNYVREHGWLFNNNDVEDVPHAFNYRHHGDIYMLNKTDVPLHHTVAFAVDVVLSELYRQLRKHREHRERKLLMRRPAITFDQMELADIDLSAGVGENPEKPSFISKAHRVKDKIYELRDRIVHKVEKTLIKLKIKKVKANKGKGVASRA